MLFGTVEERGVGGAGPASAADDEPLSDRLDQPWLTDRSDKPATATRSPPGIATG